MIDLRSDTFSLPSEAMRRALRAAEVGDDYYQEDASATRLEHHCCELFEKEAAIFTTSGMLANQLAVATQASRGNEVVTEYGYHLHLFESAQHASLAHVVLNARTTADGVLRASDVQSAIASKPRDPIYAQVQLVTIENPIGSRQGKIFPIEEIRALRQLTFARGIRFHLDGARIFNAHIATGISLPTYARECDTMTISFSKGLGAPFGSMLLGSAEIIQRARQLRVWYGSGFHQIGLMAQAAYFALTQQMDRIAEDHRLAKLLVTLLHGQGLPVDTAAVETNMVYLDLSSTGIDPSAYAARCEEQGVLVLHYPPDFIRMVVCRNVNENDIRQAAHLLAREFHTLQQTG